MPENTNIVGNLPEFTEGSMAGGEEVKEEVAEEVESSLEAEETDTPEEPSTSKEPEEAETKAATTDTGDVELQRQVSGLQSERVKLLKEISELKGQKRELKREELLVVDKQIDELKDVAPEDVQTIDRILKAKGYLTKEEVGRERYQTVQNDELAKFLDKYPEYKPENDPNDVNWASLQKELAFFRLPDNPKLIGEVLERANRAVIKSPRETDTKVAERRIKNASMGGGGIQQSSSKKSFNPQEVEIFRRGGWSDEEIEEMQ